MRLLQMKFIQNFDQTILAGFILLHLQCLALSEEINWNEGNFSSCILTSFPKITKQLPNDVIPLKQETNRIECKASGNNVRYRWKINGKNITSNETHFLLNELRNELTIKNQQYDISEYQCFAENEFGTASSNPVFYRKSFPRTIYRKYTETFNAILGKPEKMYLYINAPNVWPKPKIDWTISSKDHQPIDNHRFTKGPDGTLYISNIISNDVNLTIICTIESPVMPLTKIPAYLNITRDSTPTQSTPIYQWVDGNVSAVENKKFEMFCIYGGPTSLTTIWKKNGAEILSDRIQLGANNKSLIFNTVSRDDEGLYICQVADSVTKDIVLTVNIAPYFEYKSSDTVRIEGEAFEFKCVAKGKPKPSVHWFYNGEAIISSTANINTDDTALIINNVSVQNKGIYGCLAKNEIGYIYHEIRLYVIKVSPNMQQVPCTNPGGVSAKESKPSGFIINWKPIPQCGITFHYRVYWKPDFANKAWNVTDSNQTSVIIHQVLNKPYRYKVVTANACGDLNANSQEQVINPTCILQAFPLGSTALLIRWQKPMEKNFGYTVSSSNGLNKTVNVRSITQTKLTGLQKNTTCRISLSIVIASMQQKPEPDCIIESRTLVSDSSVKPDKPSFAWIQLQSENAYAIRVTWMPNVNGNPGRNFYVKYREIGKKWIITEEITDDDFYEIHSLSTGKIYEFAVVSLDGNFNTESDIQRVEIVKIEMAKKNNRFELESGEMEIDCLIRNTNLLLMEMDLVMNWDWPHKTIKEKENRVKVLDPLKENCRIVENGQEKCDLIYRLIVKDLKKIEDQGLYQCTLKDGALIIDSATLNVTNILAICKTFVNITLISGPRNETFSSNVPSVTWKAELSGYPNPSFSWYSNHGDEIPYGSTKNTNLKFLSTENGKIISLTVSNLTMKDSGFYNLIGYTGKEPGKKEQMSIFIQGKPELNMPQTRTIVKINETANVICNIFAYPKANISWEFKCLSSKSCNSRILSETEFNFTGPEFNRTSITNFIPDGCGTLVCQAENELGGNEKNVTLFVHDLNRELDTWTEESVSINYYYVNVACGAAKYEYSEVNWYRNGSLMNESSHFPLISKDTDFSIRKIVHLNKISIASVCYDNYVCRATVKGTNVTEENNFFLKSFCTQESNVTYGPLDTNQSRIIIIGMSALIFVLMLSLIYCIVQRRRQKKIYDELKKAGIAYFREGNINCLNPELALDTQADLLPYDENFEYPSDKLHLIKPIGGGAFGCVYEATARGIVPHQEKTTVAVKMSENIADVEMMKALVSELKIMIHLGKHLNVLNLLGAVTKNISKRELMIIVEYCPFGSLESFLVKHRRHFVNQIVGSTDKIDPNITFNDRDSSTNIKVKSLQSRNNSNDPQFLNNLEKMLNSGMPLVTQNTTCNSRCTTQSSESEQAPQRSVTTTDLLIWLFQISRGMQYLASRKVLHGDLAARNILLCDNNVVKICDFGLARSMYNKNYYRKNHDKEVRLPLMWLALESINDFVFSTYSDVWSFGIVMWELFSLGATPYPKIAVKSELKFLLNDGYRMEKPEFATQAIYDIMLSCWCVNPEKRPLFDELERNISKLLEESVFEHYIDLNDPYVKENAGRFDSGQTDYFSSMGPPDYDAPALPNRNLHKKYFPFLTDILDDNPTATNNLYVCEKPSKSCNINLLEFKQLSTFKNNHLYYST